MIRTQFNNKKSIATSHSIIKLLQDKFGNKTPLQVSINADGTVKKLIIDKELSSADKKWVKDKYPELN